KEAAKAGLGLVERGDAYSGISHRLHERVAGHARLEPGGQSEEGSVAHTAAEADEPGCLEAPAVQEDTRPQGEERRRSVRLLPDDAGHPQGRVADGDGVPRREGEPTQDGLLDYHAPTREQLVERTDRHGVEPPVERVAALDRLQLDEERAALRG